MGKEIKKCTIVSGAPNDDIEFLKDNIDASSYLIAADSGYLKLLKAGFVPDTIVADFDSAEKPDLDCEIITFPVEKAYTDTVNAVRLAVERGYEDITVFFAIGNRFDHTYTNVLCLDYCRRHHVKCRIVDRNNRLSLITQRTVFQKEYDYFSLFAFLEECRGVKIKGAYYTQDFYGLSSLDISLSDVRTQCNYICDESCEISLDSGTLLLAESND